MKDKSISMIFDCNFNYYMLFLFKKMGGRKMKLEVKNLKKSFDGNEVLHGISFSLTSGKALGLLGRNGAGKTTTIRILMDVFKANSGEVLLDGKPFNPQEYQIGYMPEERGMYPKKKVMEQLLYFGELRGLPRKEVKKNAIQLMEKLEILDYQNRKLETLSKGNQQKVQLVQTLVCDPNIIILDEPFSGLDPVNSQLLKELIQEEIEKGKMVIFSSHQMGYVEEFCEEIVIINKGEIVISGNLDTIKKEMGKDKGILSVNNMSIQELEGFVNEECKEEMKVVDKKKDLLIFEILTNKKDILNKITNANIDVEVFGDYKPSLTDIFVWKAGE